MVRRRSAKPLFSGSNPDGASNSNSLICAENVLKSGTRTRKGPATLALWACAFLRSYADPRSGTGHILSSLMLAGTTVATFVCGNEEERTCTQ